MEADLSTRQAAERISVHHKTLLLWANEGKVPHYRTPGGHLRFRPADIEKLRETITPKAAS